MSILNVDTDAEPDTDSDISTTILSFTIRRLQRNKTVTI